MIKQGKYLILFALYAFILAACTQERQPCLTPVTASLRIKTVHFRSDTSTVITDTLLPHAVFGAMTDSGTKYFLNSSRATFAIWLSPLADSCKWLVEPDSLKGTPDTLTFYYKRNLQFVSNACGYAYTYTLNSVISTHQFIDSLHISNANVTTNVNTNHLQIYIHPAF